MSTKGEFERSLDKLVDMAFVTNPSMHPRGNYEMNIRAHESALQQRIEQLENGERQWKHLAEQAIKAAHELEAKCADAVSQFAEQCDLVDGMHATHLHNLERIQQLEAFKAKVEGCCTVTLWQNTKTLDVSEVEHKSDLQLPDNWEAVEFYAVPVESVAEKEEGDGL